MHCVACTFKCLVFVCPSSPKNSSCGMKMQLSIKIVPIIDITSIYVYTRVLFTWFAVLPGLYIDNLLILKPTCCCRWMAKLLKFYWFLFACTSIARVKHQLSTAMYFGRFRSAYDKVTRILFTVNNRSVSVLVFYQVSSI